jgi:hypothetical protein
MLTHFPAYTDHEDTLVLIPLSNKTQRFIQKVDKDSSFTDIVLAAL